MNGRIYDPTLGRFLQADPFIQAPINSQSYNRYSYVLNNPLSYTDPSGYFFKKLFKAIGGNKFLSTIISIGLNFIPGCQAWCSAAFNAAITYAVTGSLKGALIGAFVGAISPGGFNPGAFLARATIGGFASRLQGGKFGHGFIAAGASGAAGGIKNVWGRIVASAVIGGTVSKITGGKFANAATSASFAAALVAGFNGEFSKNSARSNNGLPPRPRDLSEEDQAEFDSKLDALRTNVSKEKFGTHREAAEWLHDNVHELASQYDIEIGADIRERITIDGQFVSIGGLYSQNYRNSVNISHHGDAIAEWHSHAKISSDFTDGADTTWAIKNSRHAYISTGHIGGGPQNQRRMFYKGNSSQICGYRCDY